MSAFDPKRTLVRAGQIEQDAGAQRLRDHTFIHVEIDQHAYRNGDECRPYQSGEKQRAVHGVHLALEEEWKGGRSSS